MAPGGPRPTHTTPGRAAPPRAAPPHGRDARGRLTRAPQGKSRDAPTQTVTRYGARGPTPHTSHTETRAGEAAYEDKEHATAGARHTHPTSRQVRPHANPQPIRPTTRPKTPRALGNGHDKFRAVARHHVRAVWAASERPSRLRRSPVQARGGVGVGWAGRPLLPHQRPVQRSPRLAPTTPYEGVASVPAPPPSGPTPPPSLSRGTPPQTGPPRGPPCGGDPSPSARPTRRAPARARPAPLHWAPPRFFGFATQTGP